MNTGVICHLILQNFLVAEMRLYTLLCWSVGWYIRNKFHLFPSGFCITAPAQLSATGLPCIRPCFKVGCYGWLFRHILPFFRCAIALLQEPLSVGRSRHVTLVISPSVGQAQMKYRRKCLKSIENSFCSSLMVLVISFTIIISYS